MPKLHWIQTPLPCALILCIANAFKPPLIDDTAYLWYARQIQQTPLQPFGPPPGGFPLIWYSQVQGAFFLLIPMVVPYWLGLGLDCFGEDIVLLKLWLFPFCWLFTAALNALFRRFAPGWERPLLLMTVLSPTFLPSVNLMVDLPALALALGAIVLFFRAMNTPRTNYLLVALSGLSAGLAAQTKYNAAIGTAALLLAGILFRRRGAAMVAVFLSVAVFVGWEAYLLRVYGKSHFLSQVQARQETPPGLAPGAGRAERLLAAIEHFVDKKAALITPLIGNLGGLIPALALLGAVGLRYSSAMMRAGSGFLVLGFTLMAVVPNDFAVFTRDSKGQEEVTLGTIFVSIAGGAGCWLICLVSIALGFRRGPGPRPRVRRDPLTWFLIGWMTLELLGYFILSPFPAARRSMGFVVAATLLVGRLLSRTRRGPAGLRAGRLPVYLGVGFGILFGVVDTLDAWPEPRAATSAIDWIHQQPGGDRPIWFSGHWGFQFACEQAGAKPIDPNLFQADRGDWLILPEGYRPHAQLVDLSEQPIELRLETAWRIRMGLRTIPDYYCGYMPIRHHEGDRVVVHIWRVR